MAQAILLQDVENVGSRGEVIDVSPGYLRNYLLPRKLAHQATPGALADAQRRMEAAEQAAKDAADRAQENAALLSRTVLTIPQPAGEDGRLFGSVTSEDIVNAIKQARGLKLDRRKVHLEQPIRTTGTHMVTVEVHDGVTADVKTIVTPEG
jgi:large subunit ribosomal protein L9